MDSSIAPFVKKPSGKVHWEVDPRALFWFYDRMAGHLIPFDEEYIGDISSPYDLYIWEKYRRKHALRSTKAVSADVFLWGRGEAPDRFMTKIGGLPYLPASRTWPTFEGKRATFLAQFNFLDSRDIVQELPGDLLMVFVRDEEFLFETDAYAFEWVDMTEEPLVSQRDASMPAWVFATLFGVRHRAYDDPSMYPAAEKLDPDLERGLPFLPVLQGTKIGGTLWDTQQPYPDIPDRLRFICELGSFFPSGIVPWPWVNREEPIDWEKEEEDSSLTIQFHDMGCIGFCLDDDGAVHPWPSTG